MAGEVKFTVRLPDVLYRALRKEADRRGESMTTLLRTLLREGLAR